MARRRKRITSWRGDFPRTTNVLSAAIRYTWILFLGLAILYVSVQLSNAHANTTLSETVNIVGVAVISVLAGLLIYDLFGGPPELRELRSAFEEFRLGCRTQAQGITALYQTREAAKQDVLDDLRLSNRSCRMYAAVYISEVIKHSDFNAYIAKAAQAARAANEKYIFSYCSLDPNPTNAHEQAVLEVWAKRERDDTTQAIKYRIEKGTEMFALAVRSIMDRAGTNNIEVTRRYFKDYLCPHSLLIIDDRVVYVSFYDWYHDRGDHAPTLRLENGPWAQTFMREADKINKSLSVDAGIRFGVGS